MLMLFYSLLTGYFAFFTLFLYTYQERPKILIEISNRQVYYLTITLLLGIICLILTKFSFFHLQLVIKNSTTIESLENSYNFRYSLSKKSNFTQVFGENWRMWLVPFYSKSGMPSGNGVVWPLVAQIQSDSDVNVESEVNPHESPTRQIGNLNEIWKSPVLPDKDPETDTSFIRLNNNI